MNLLSVILSRKYLLPAFIILLLIFIYSLWGRMPDIDDAWIGVDAYTLAMDGYVHNDLMRGINLQEEFFVVHHKLLNLQGALLIKTFGFSLYTLKSLSLIYFIVFICLFYFYTVKWKQLFNGNDLLFSMVLLFAFPWISKYAFVYRPEIMMMTYGFVGYIFMENYLGSAEKRGWQLFLSGIFFGLTMATHLNGLILATAAFFLLLWNKKFGSVFVYGAGVVLAFLIYFYDYTDLSYFDLWRLQFFNAPYLDSMDSGPAWLKPLFNLLKEHMRYFHNLKIIVYSVFLITTMLVGFKFLYRNQTNLTRFALLVAVMTGILAMHKSRQYFLLNIPYLVILITLTFKALKDGKITRFVVGKITTINAILVFLLFVFLLASTFYNIKFSLQKFTPKQNRELALRYADGRESEMNIVAPMSFFFDEVENFKRIQSDLCYIQLQKMDSSVYGKGFLQKASTFDAELIMVEPFYQPLLGIDHFSIGDTTAGYLVIDKTDHSLVFKRLH
jgi:hypothetical protein